MPAALKFESRSPEVAAVDLIVRFGRDAALQARHMSLSYHGQDRPYAATFYARVTELLTTDRERVLFGNTAQF